MRRSSGQVTAAACSPPGNGVTSTVTGRTGAFILDGTGGWNDRWRVATVEPNCASFCWSICHGSWTAMSTRPSPSPKVKVTACDPVGHVCAARIRSASLAHPPTGSRVVQSSNTGRTLPCPPRRVATGPRPSGRPRPRPSAPAPPGPGTAGIRHRPSRGARRDPRRPRPVHDEPAGDGVTATLARQSPRRVEPEHRPGFRGHAGAHLSDVTGVEQVRAPPGRASPTLRRVPPCDRPRRGSATAHRPGPPT